MSDRLFDEDAEAREKSDMPKLVRTLSEPTVFDTDKEQED